MSTGSTNALIGLGANLGDARGTIIQAVAAIARFEATTFVACSSHYSTAPLGYEDQPPFVNAVAKFATFLAPHVLLDNLQELERQYGRQRSFPNAPRTLDLDLLLYGSTVLSSPTLTLPHPRMCERAFVLIPLVEICPSIEIPGRGRASEHLAQVVRQHVVRLAERDES
ncbi:MAG: 2-amino-4-hydroxy-6-hydroxymethyldihydropteridine diphosphokinase [Betaproteobacteria bacterium]|nr:2-amino-4-hydroxy-6-hydroxymethyldihydropteridine diphosphokinase [Betaproteobacteria bacterium]